MRNHRLKTNKIGDKIDPALLDQPGFHCDGAGLYLQVARDEEGRATGGASYVYRHKTKWASIGSANVYSIKEARETAAKLWTAAGRKEDPIALLKTLRGSPTAVTGKTFAEAMAEYLAAKSPHWADSNRDRELRRYEFLFGQIPAFVALPVKAIDQNAKNAALATWNGQTKKRSDVGYYIGAIINYAETGQLRGIKAAAVEHHPEMPYRDVPAFYARLGALGTANAMALQFLILTGAPRTSELIGAKHKAPATWGEITKVEGEPTWIIPGNRMKAKQIHRIPLSSAAVALLGKRKADNIPLFKTSSSDALLDTLKANGGNGFTVHGFRTSMQEWGLATTKYPADLIEMCIAHDKRGSVTKAYQRSDRLAERRPILQEWSDYLTG
jgi:integrase